jgi:hypothetical protein
MIDSPVSDTSRATMHEADRTWPHSVKIAVHWRDEFGRTTVRTEVISSEQFFGLGKFGAPLSGDHVISLIERMRRAGPPKIVRKGKRNE